MENNLSIKIWNVKNELKRIRKSTQGFKFKYTNLSDVQKNLKPELVKQNLGYSHNLRVVGIDTLLTTTVFSLKDPSDCLVAEMIIPRDVSLSGMNAYQSIGSAITYFRRYQLTTIFGIITDEDVDALKSQEPPAPKINYVAKIQQLIKIGRDSDTLNRYYKKQESKMTDAEKTEILKIIKDKDGK